MKVVGIVAEYNPFHNGHFYHITKAREKGADAVVAVMSGNFVQRAEVAVLNKHSRAESAILGGVDLVIELPLRFSIASAEHFAFGAVYLLNSLGIIDELFFGSESGDMDSLSHICDLLCEIEKDGLIKKYLSGGEPYIYARQKALSEKGLAEKFNKPNDILAVEYLKALRKLNSSVIPQTIPRLGSYDGTDIYIKNRLALTSASAIRNLILNKQEFIKFVPKTTYDIFDKQKSVGQAPADMKNIERTILAFFRMAKYRDFSNIYAISEGIENRILKASAAADLHDFYKRIKTKRYTMATVRRAVLCSFFGIKKQLLSPPYIHVLAFNDMGRKLLKMIKKSSDLPILNTLAKTQHDKFGSFIDEECLAGDIFNLATPVVGGIYSDFTQSPKYITDIER